MKNKLFIRVLIGILAGIALNLIPRHIVQVVLELPFFMDTLGSITVVFFFGAFPAIICATITQIAMAFIESYTSAVILLYVLTVYASIGIVCMFRKSLTESDSVLSTAFILLFISILTILAVSITGGIVNFICVYVQESTDSPIQNNPATTFFQFDLFKMGLSSLPTYIFSRIPGNLVERPVITLMAFGINFLYKKTFASNRESHSEKQDTSSV